MADQNNVPLGQSDLDNVYKCLVHALDPSTHKEAEHMLSTLAARPGFCSCLVEIISSREADEAPRWLASVNLKNTVNKLWRTRRDQSGLSDAEKSHLRPKLLGLIGLEDEKVAIQIAVIFSKIARFDFPTHWPGLFTDLMGLLNSGFAPMAKRVYLVQHHILKELSTKRLPADQKLFAEVTKQLYEPFWTQWCQDSQPIVEQLQKVQSPVAQDHPLVQLLDRWLIFLKAIRRMLLFGFQSDARTLEPTPTVTQAVPVMLKVLQTLLSTRPKDMQAESPLCTSLAKGMIKLAKTMVDLQQMHPWAFCKAGVIVPCLELFVSEFVFGSHTPEPVFEGLLIQFTKLIKNVTESKPYNGIGVPLSMSDNCAQEDRLKALAAAVKPLLTAYWGAGHAQALCESIIKRRFQLREQDLEQWFNNPEQFYHTWETSAQTTENIRGASESLFMALMKAHRGMLGPAVVSALQSVIQSCPAGSLPQRGPEIGGIPAGVLEKEAVYHAVAVGMYELYDYVEFTEWYTSSLLQELNDKNPKLWPLRRQSAVLIGAWVSKLSDDDRQHAYRGVISLLSESDLCLKLTAVDSLRLLIDDWAFRDKEFSEFAGPALELLAQVLQTSEELDTQVKVFGLVNLIVEQMGDEVKPLASGIVQLLPRVWNQAEGQSLLRMQVLTAYQHLLNALGEESVSTYPWLVPAISYSISMDNPESLTLREDGLHLWLVALRNCPPSQGQPLLDLFTHIPKIIEGSTEFLGVCMAIISSCSMLGGAWFLNKFTNELQSVFVVLIGAIRDAAYGLISPAMEMIIKVAPQEGARLLEIPLMKLVSYLLTTSEVSGQPQGANAIVFSAVMMVFARIFACNPGFIPESMGKFAANGQFGETDGGKLLCSFLDLWMDQFDALASESARKLNTIALCNLITLPIHGILDRLDVIFANVTAVCNELEGGAVAEKAIDGLSAFGLDFGGTGPSRFQSSGAVQASEDAQPEIDRKRVVYENDVVNHVKVSAYLKEKLRLAEQVHGQRFSQVVNSLDPSLRHSLQSIVGN